MNTVGDHTELCARAREVTGARITGGDDPAVMRMDGAALCRLVCRKEMKEIPGATQLFDEPGALEMVAAAAGAWFQQHLPPVRSVREGFSYAR